MTGPGTPCTIDGFVTAGPYQVEYTYEDHDGEHSELVANGSCDQPTCPKGATGYPGSVGFSIDMDLFGNNAVITEVSSIPFE